MFSRAEVPVWGFHEVGRGAQGASRVVPGKSGLHVGGEGERIIALELRSQLPILFPVNLSIILGSGPHGKDLSPKLFLPACLAGTLRSNLKCPLNLQGDLMHLKKQSRGWPRAAYFAPVS